MFSWRPGRLARSSGSLLLWMVLRAVVQALAVLILARLLGPAGYGQFVAILATAAFVTPFVGLGLSNIVLRNGVKDPAGLNWYQAKAMRLWRLSLLPAILVACLLATLLLPTDIPKVAAFSAIVAELVTTSLVELRARYRQAQHRISSFGAINAGLPLIRLAVLSVLYFSAQGDEVQRVLWVYAAASLAYCVWLWLPYRESRQGELGTEAMAWGDGVSFGMAAFTLRLQGEFNKPVLAHLGFDLVGAYNAAQRTADLASMPLSALQESLWPRLYSKNATPRQLRVSSLLLLLLAAFCGAGIWLLAPLLPQVLGGGFAGAVTTARWLALLPLLQSIRALLNFQLIQCARMKLIGWASAMGAAASVLGVWLLVPRRGIEGAVMSAYVTEMVMMVVLVGGVVHFRRRAD